MSSIATNTLLLRDVLRIPQIQNELTQNSASKSQSQSANSEKVHYFFENPEFAKENVDSPNPVANNAEDFLFENELEKLMKKLELAENEDSNYCWNESDEDETCAYDSNMESFGTLCASNIINRFVPQLLTTFREINLTAVKTEKKL